MRQTTRLGIQIMFSLLFACAAHAAVAQTAYYWEKPRAITSLDSRFPVAATNGTVTALFFEEVAGSDIWINIQTQAQNGWERPRRIAGPFAYSGDVPDIFSVAISPRGDIALSVLISPQSVGVYVSHDGGQTFSLRALPRQTQSVIGPRIFCASQGNFMLFTALGENDRFALLVSESENGDTWSPLAPFEPAKKYENPFAPYLAVIENRDVVVFQVQYTAGTRLSYQLCSSYSDNGGKSWSPAPIITNEASLPANAVFSNYHNQRPAVFASDGQLYLAWERTYYTSESAHIWVAELTRDGALRGTAEEVTTSGNAHRPQLFSYNNTVNLVWFDNRRGTDSVYMAEKNGFLWNETRLSSESNASTFAYPLIANKELSFVWQQATGRGGNPRIYLLETDHTVAAPVVIARSFTKGKRATAERVTARVQLPEDSSGIAGYSWLWTDDPKAEPPQEFMCLPDETALSGNATKDGTWYFKVRAADYAGNWSDSGVLSYTRDTTPPLAPVITPAQTDRFGFVDSNTFTLNWLPNPDDDDDIAGYSWNLSYVAPLDASVTETKLHPITLSDDAVRSHVQSVLTRYDGIENRASPPPRRNLGNVTSTSFQNRQNGLYTFSVCAIDSVGNIGPATAVTLLLNKYIPSTAVVAANAKTDTFGKVTLSLAGRGFTYDGTIQTIYIDADGKPPYDKNFIRKNGDFTVTSDERITGISFDDLEAGTYRIGLVHPGRGLYFSGRILTINDYGTVKIETPYEYQVGWKPVAEDYRYHIQTSSVLLALLFALAVLGFILSLRGMVQTARDAVTVKYEVRALLTGGVMPQERKHRTEAAIRRGVSLKYKMLGFTVGLVFAVVVLVALPLSVIMTRTQERTLAVGLEERVEVLMNGISSGVRAYLPAQNVLELSYLPGQTDSFDEALYATIVGFPADESSTDLSVVWATNDAHINEKIDSALFIGSSRLLGTEMEAIEARMQDLQKESAKQIGEMAQYISELNSEGNRLAQRTDTLSRRRFDEIASVSQQVSQELIATLDELSRAGSDSYPHFNTEKLDRSNTDYLFYKPVMFRQGSDQNYVRAIILIRVSTQNLIQQVNAITRAIIITSGIIAFAALAIGILGSLILASVIIRPIRRLVSHVEMISETQDKEKLAGKEIQITSKDEIGLLGDTVNEMTRSLVKAAQDEHLLMDGQVVQRTFLPLQAAANGAKETTSSLTEKNVQFFGYYEGASGVSGDYFDYKKLDDRWYVIIKSDASGHGVPAALIMTVVATLFRKYFEQWSFKANGTALNTLVMQINDFIESLGLKGKFATLMLCLYDTQTGDVYMCNAGDNIVHYYDVSERKEKLVTLTQTPAAGPLPSFMVDMKGGFKVEKLHLDKGDVLFLYTDGIEEATRKFRNAQFAVTPCTQGEEGAEHENHKVGEESEQLSPERINDIVEAVFARSRYVLKKYHNPIPDEELVFDFSSCQGSVEDAIIALISVEKVFRFYKEPTALETDVVRVDRKIDAFLKQHFNRYDFYCATQRDDGDTNYLYYTHLKEDEQLDDLTLIALRNV